MNTTTTTSNAVQECTTLQLINEVLQASPGLFPTFTTSLTNDEVQKYCTFSIGITKIFETYFIYLEQSCYGTKLLKTVPLPTFGEYIGNPHDIIFVDDVSEDITNAFYELLYSIERDYCDKPDTWYSVNELTKVDVTCTQLLP